MLRVLSVMLLAGASIANAGEHYSEVWNPPEARQTPHANSHTPHRPATHRVSASRATKSKPTRVMVSAPKPMKHAHVAHTVPVNAAPQVQNLPPLLTPGGNVLRVDSHGPLPEVTR
ncbi:hypothetical protein FAZ95_03240 [Trinickia violacea]|uniref:DUF4148 domain-containing protein n=1 Tax=Trinickia violacea TaxID=2571746 RepID=A0A4P8IJD1_9BURK|nr:hypothetical protein FAZ95_03240 [Trinickia violacea]